MNGVSKASTSSSSSCSFSFSGLQQLRKLKRRGRASGIFPPIRNDPSCSRSIVVCQMQGDGGSDGRNTGCPTILLFFSIFEMFIVGQPVVSLLTLSLSLSLFHHSFKKKTAMFLPLVVVVGGGAPPAVEPHASCGGNYGWMRTETPWAGKACPPPQWEPSWVTVVSLLTLSLSLSLFSLSLNDHILSLCLYIASFSRHLCGSISTVHTFILDHGLLVLPLYRTRTLLPCYRRN